MLYRYEFEFAPRNGEPINYGLMNGIGGLLEILRSERMQKYSNMEAYYKITELRNVLEYMRGFIENRLIDPLVSGYVENMHGTRSWFTEEGYRDFDPVIDLVKQNLIPGFSIICNTVEESELTAIIYRDRYQVVERFNDYRKDIMGERPMKVTE